MPWVEPIARRAAWVTIAAAVMAFLWLGKEFAFPVALAILLAFALSPVVRWLHRHTHSRLAAVAIACALGGTFIVAVTAAAGYQMVDFVGRLPDYRHNLTDKLRSIRGDGDNIWNRAKEAVERIEQETVAAVPGESPLANRGSTAMPKAVPVVLQSNHAWLDQLLSASPAFHYLATAAMVTILVVLLLMYAEDMRDRIIVLAGTQQISVTSQALEEAASKVGRYLLMLSVVNTGFGLGVAGGLYWIGIPNALLLGILAGVLRFVPLVGAWLGAAVPLMLALAVLPGWGGVVWTLALFLALEILANFLIEPLIYGHGTGISSLAVIIAILFWTLIWGGVGLLLAVPITVCVVVFGKYLEPLRVFHILLSDEPMLAGERRLYHRLVTGDVAASEQIVHDALDQSTPMKVYDDLLLPALRTARGDHARGVLSDERLAVVMDLLETITVELPTVSSEATGCAVACVAVEARDRVAARMTASAIASAIEQTVPVLESSLIADLQAVVESNGIDVLTIVSTSSDSLVRGRLLYKALSRRAPKLRVYIADLGDFAATYQQPTDANSGVMIVRTLSSMVEKINQIVRGNASLHPENAPSASPPHVPAIPAPT